MKKVYVIGDFMIDRYIIGVSNRLSPEAPIPIMKPVSEFESVGGAGNVFANIKVPCEKLDNGKKIIKTRFICNGQQVLRFDEESYEDIQVDVPRDAYLTVVSDYSKGAITNFEKILESSKYTIVDAKKKLSFYRGATIVKCNHDEYIRFSDYDVLTAAGMQKMCENYDIGTLIVTCGSSDVYVFADGKFHTFPVEHTAVSDATGAGDVFISAIATEFMKNKPILHAVQTAIKAATFSTKYTGTYVLTDSEYESCVY